LFIKTVYIMKLELLSKILIFIICLEFIQSISTNQTIYFHYFNLTVDPLESQNQYNNISTKSISSALKANGTKWFNQVGNTQIAGKKLITLEK